MFGTNEKQRVYGQSPGRNYRKKSTNHLNDLVVFQYFPFSERRDVVRLKVLRQNSLWESGVFCRTNSPQAKFHTDLESDESSPWLIVDGKTPVGTRAIYQLYGNNNFNLTGNKKRNAANCRIQRKVGL